MKRSILIFFALMSLISCNQKDPLAPFRDESKFVIPPTGKSITVMTYNIFGASGNANLDSLAVVINGAEPDFVLLQEVDSCTPRSGRNIHQAKELAKKTGMKYCYQVAWDRGKDVDDIPDVNVLVVLVLGILATLIIGLACGSLLGVTFFEEAGKGVLSMGELIIITLMAGGLMNMVKASGGFDFITRAITNRVSGRRGAESAIAGLTVLTDICTANNTIAIITVGPIAHDLSERYGIPARKSASLMDTASCFAQGVLPYGAQLLMASGLASVSPVEIIPHLYYPMAIGVMVVLSIIFQFPRVRR